MLALPVLAMTACSFNKNADDDQSGMGAAGTGAESSMSSEEQARRQMQELQKNNIVYFAFDKYEIDPKFDDQLSAHAAFLNQNKSYKIVIQGHADERGTPEYNIALGEKRANAVKMYLQGKGVGADQMGIVSYGKEKPAVEGHNEEAYAKNRRSVLVY